jgi:antitoxin (DNA-binding transcriptional repressor) of toxin-antitoxin stability system/predicted HTH domain antitoxin
MIALEETQARLSELIHQLSPGEQVVITENDQPVAQLLALRTENPQSVPGRCQGMLTIISEDDEHLAMPELVTPIPVRFLPVLGVTPERAGDEVLMLAAVKLYQMSRLSSGAAAEFAGVCKPEFMLRLGHYGVPAFDLTQDDFDQELAVV